MHNFAPRTSSFCVQLKMENELLCTTEHRVKNSINSSTCNGERVVTMYKFASCSFCVQTGITNESLSCTT